MPESPGGDYRKEILHQREAWERKAVLRELYQHWYARIVAALAPCRPVVEIGAGCGNFKAYFPECIATDTMRSGPWIDRVVDAHELPFQPEEVGNLVLFDCLHHLRRPLRFLQQAERVLKPGGRLLLCEPAMTPWARLVYGLCHHEPCDIHVDLFSAAPQPPEAEPGHTFANAAIPELLLWRRRKQTLSYLPDMHWHSGVKFAFLLYPLTGGFNYRGLVPVTGFRQALLVEDALLRPFASWLTGLRMLVVLEKNARRQP